MTKRKPRGPRDCDCITDKPCRRAWTTGTPAARLCQLRKENARLQKALDIREDQYIKLLHTKQKGRAK